MRPWGSLHAAQSQVHDPQRGSASSELVLRGGPPASAPRQVHGRTAQPTGLACVRGRGAQHGPWAPGRCLAFVSSRWWVKGLFCSCTGPRGFRKGGAREVGMAWPWPLICVVQTQCHLRTLRLNSCLLQPVVSIWGCPARNPEAQPALDLLGSALWGRPHHANFEKAPQQTLMP